MKRFEKIKQQIAAASVEEMVEIMFEIDDLLFWCKSCEVANCETDCKKHCLNWLNSPVPDE